MLVALVLLVLIAGLFLWYAHEKGEGDLKGDALWAHAAGVAIARRASLEGKVGTFVVTDSPDTKVVFGQVPAVHLATRRSDGRPFARNSVVYALCHELAHLACPECLAHQDPFGQHEYRLLAAAEHLKMYDPAVQLEDDYPCRA